MTRWVPVHDRPRAVSVKATWQQARKVLAVRLDNLGDVLMTTPALAAMRAELPHSHLTLLTSVAGAALLPHLPFLDDAIVFEAPWVASGATGRDEAGDGMAEQRMLARLAAARFDAAVIFTVCTQSALPAALFCKLAGVPLRLAHSRENPYHLLTDWVRDHDLPVDGVRHEVTRQLDLVAAIGLDVPGGDPERLHFALRDADVTSLRVKLAAAGCDPAQPYFVVHPGASAPSRRYPAGHFAAAARGVAERSGQQAVFVGGASEAELVSQARAGVRGRTVSLVGQLALGELAALIAGASVMLCNNSAPAHLAAAVGGRVVVMYALTNPQHTPWKAEARVMSHPVACRNCLKSVCPQLHHACLREVNPQQVAEAALGLMVHSPSRRGVFDAT